MRVSIDTDVLLDVALARDPHLAASRAVLEWVENGGEAAVAWHSLANCSVTAVSPKDFIQLIA